MASRGKREYRIKALDADEAVDLAIDEATRPNWRVRQMRGVRPTVHRIDTEWWKVTLWVTELPH